MRKFKDKTVWITGASAGIGEGLAYAFAKEGANLILSARRIEKLEAVKKNCPKDVKVTLFPFDLSNPDEVSRLAKEFVSKQKEIHVLVNNGGVSQRSLAKETSFDIDKRIIEINLLSTMALTKAVLPKMLTQQEGHIIATSSLVGKFSTPLRSAYSASKHAIHGYYDGLRSELSVDNIKFTILCPGFIKTDISMNAINSNGEATNVMDEAQSRGMSVEKFSIKAMKAIKSEKREAYIGGKEPYAVYLSRFFPGIFAKMIGKAKVT